MERRVRPHSHSFTDIAEEGIDNETMSSNNKSVPMYSTGRRGTHDRKKVLASCTTMSFEDLSADGATPFDAKFEELFVQHHSGVYDSRMKKLLSLDEYVIDPATTWKVWWDIFVGLNILYSAIVVPFRLGFHVTVNLVWLYAEISVDIVFFFDMVLSFLTSYSDNGEMVKHAEHIAAHYLKTWFLFDLVSTVPFYLIGDSGSLKTLKLVRIVRLFRLLKLIRLVRLNHKLSNAKTSGHITLVFYELSMVIILTLFLSHLFSCLFYSFSPCDGAKPSDEFTWEQCGSLDNVYSQYLLSFYWTLSTVLKVGYGDVLLTTDGGRLYSVAVMLMGSIISGYILAVMLKQAESANPLVAEKTRRMSEMGVYLHEKQVPRRVMQRLWKHFEYYYSQLSTLQEPQDMCTTPPCLRLELFNIMRSDVVKLKMFNKEFLLFSELQRHFHPFLAESGELIVNENDHCSDIFFVIHGCVEGMKRVKHTSVPDDGLQALVGVWTDGSHFGIGTAMLTEGTYWAKHISKTVSDMVWIDLSTLSLSPATGAILKAAAQLEVNNHAVIQSQLKNTLMDEEGNCFTPLMIFNEKVLTSNEYKERGLMNRGSEKSMYRSSSGSESLKNDCTDTCYDDLTYRVVRLTGEVINGHREYEVVLETTLDMLKRGVINPHWRVKMYYDLFIIVCTIVSVFTLPLRFGFNIPDSTGWIVYDVIIEMAFLSDMGLEFVTAYERSDFLLNTEHKFIALNYIKGWFILDLIAGFPFSLMLADSQLTLLKLFKLFRIIRIMRILKVLKVSRILKVLKVSKVNATKFTTPFTSLENVSMRFIRCVVVVLIVTHFAACGWAKLDSVRRDGQTWTNDNNAPVGEDLVSRYIAAIYWAVATATGTGYGDIVGQNDGERLADMVFMMGGVCTMVYLVGQVADSEKDEARENGIQRTDVVRAYLAEQALPEGLKFAVLRHFAYNSSVRSDFNEVQMWKRMPFLTRISIALAAHRVVVKAFPSLFPADNPSLSYVLLKYLDPTFVVHGTYVFTFETGSAGVYLLLSGEGEIVDERPDKTEEILGSIVAGQKFGQEAFLREGITFIGVRAVKDMSMYVMTSSGVNDLVADHPFSSAALLGKVQSGSNTLTTAHYVGDISEKRKQLKRVEAVKYHNKENTLLEVANWIMEEDEPVSDIAHHRCIRSHITENGVHDEHGPELLEAINKNSPSLSLSFEGRNKFIDMKKKLWAATDMSKS